jgi:hypothetical protein
LTSSRSRFITAREGKRPSARVSVVSGFAASTSSHRVPRSMTGVQGPTSAPFAALGARCCRSPTAAISAPNQHAPHDGVKACLRLCDDRLHHLFVVSSRLSAPRTAWACRPHQAGESASKRVEILEQGHKQQGGARNRSGVEPNVKWRQRDRQSNSSLGTDNSSVSEPRCSIRSARATTFD